MKRVLALIFMMVLAVSLSSCADSSQEVEVVPNQNTGAQADGSSLMPDTGNEIAEQFMTEHYTTKTNIEDVINDPVFRQSVQADRPVDGSVAGDYASKGIPVQNLLL